MAGVSDITTENPEVDSAIYVLLDELGTEKFILLATELNKLVNDPGYGEINIRIYDHRVKVVQILKSFK